MAKKPDPLQQMTKALGHPLRVRILEFMGERECSPNEIRLALEENLSNVSYHMRTLEEHGAIEGTRTEPCRGAVEHFYKRTGTILPDKVANTALDAIAKVLRSVDGRKASPGDLAAAVERISEALANTGRKV